MCTYDGDEEEMMSEEVTHIVAEVENNIHTKVRHVSTPSLGKEAETVMEFHASIWTSALCELGAPGSAESVQSGCGCAEGLAGVLLLQTTTSQRLSLPTPAHIITFIHFK